MVGKTEVLVSENSRLRSSAESLPVRAFEFPKTPVEFRVAVGLPELPLLSPEEAFEERKRRVEGYTNQQTASIPRNFFSGGPQSLEYEESKIQRQAADQGFATRIWRGLMRRQLTGAGVEHAAQLLQIVEENVNIFSRRDLKPATLVQLLKASDQQDEVEALKKIDLAFDRARQLYITYDSGDFKDTPNQSTEFIGVLANTPEDQWQEIYHQFDGRTQVMYNPRYSTFGQANLNGLLQIIKQGGLTDEHQQTLTKVAVWNRFGHALPFLRESTEGKSYEYWLDYNDLLDPAVGWQIDKYYPYLIDWAALSLPAILAEQAGKHTSIGVDSNCDGRDLIAGLRHLEARGKLAYLKSLINAGWDCYGIYNAMRGLGYHADVSEQLERIDQTLAQATTFQSDPDNMSWVRVFNEHFHGMTKLFTTQIPAYEEIIRNKDTLVSIALILDSLPKIEGFKAEKFFKMEDGKAKIDRHELSFYLKDVVRQGNITDFDRRYVNGLLKLSSYEEERFSGPKYIPDERLSFYLYLTAHKNKVVPQIFDSEGNLAVQAAFLNDLSNQGVAVESKLMGDFVSKCADRADLSFNLKMTYFDKLYISERVNTLTTLPDELLAGLPVEMQTSIVFFRRLSPQAQNSLVVEGINGLSKYINNGQPTAVCVDNALACGYFQEIRHFLTPELMSSFAPEQRQFFQACLNLPAEVVKLMSQGAYSEWKRRFIDGNPAPAFLRMVALKGQHGEIDIVLAITDLSTFSPSEQAYWSFYKSIPASPYLRSYLLHSEGKFPKLVVNGQPTVALLEDLAQEVQVYAIREVLPYIKVDDLPDQQRAFWEFYPKLDQVNSDVIREYLLRHRGQFAELIQSNRATPAFLNHAATFVNGTVDVNLIKDLLNWVDTSQMSSQEQTFWRYYSNNQDTPFSLFLLRNRSQFSQMIMNGHQTPVFYQLLAIQEPNTMLEIYRHKPGLPSRQYQDLWRLAIGKEVIDNFLATLPKATDEARNAFTGNQYDRTTEFIRYLIARMPGQLELTAAEFSIMSPYVTQFGLARNEAMYKYYRILYLFEHQQIADLPDEMKNLGIASTAEMIQKIYELRRMVYGERQLTDPTELRNLTSFQRQMLANITGYDTARFGQGDANRLSAKIDQFAADLGQGLIIPTPAGYEPAFVEASSVKVEFNGAAIKGDYEILRREILECIDNPPTIDRLKAAVRAVIERRVGKIHDTLSRVKAGEAVAAMTRDLVKLQSYLTQLDQVPDIDSLTLTLLGMNFSNEDRHGREDFTGIDSVIRRIILSKLYRRNERSPGFIENTRIKLSKDEITAEGIDEIILTVDEMIKNHVLSLDLGNKEGHWRAEVLKAIIENGSLRRNFRRIVECFNPYAEKLRQEQTRFVKTQTGKVSKVKVIPDRGFIGEMAGYLADVCYVRVGDLLKTYSGKTAESPLVIPHKFVIEDAVSAEPRFIGSVLIFETQTATGELSILVRALDIPNESEIDVGQFIEKLLDKFAAVAAKRGRKKVQLAGTPSTISNYSGTISHVLGKYVKDKAPDPVSPIFDFNGYNITNQIYTARTISI